MKNAMTFFSAILVVVLACCETVSAETDFSPCLSVKAGIASSPTCRVVEHLQNVLTEMHNLQTDSDDHKERASRAAQVALDEMQAYRSPEIIAEPGVGEDNASQK